MKDTHEDYPVDARKHLLAFLARLEEHYPDQADDVEFATSMVIYNALCAVRDNKLDSLNTHNADDLMDYAHGVYKSIAFMHRLMEERMADKVGSNIMGLLRDMGFEVHRIDPDSL